MNFSKLQRGADAQLLYEPCRPLIGPKLFILSLIIFYLKNPQERQLNIFESFKVWGVCWQLHDVELFDARRVILQRSPPSKTPDTRRYCILHTVCEIRNLAKKIYLYITAAAAAAAAACDMLHIIICVSGIWDTRIRDTVSTCVRGLKVKFSVSVMIRGWMSSRGARCPLFIGGIFKAGKYKILLPEELLPFMNKILVEWGFIFQQYRVAWLLLKLKHPSYCTFYLSNLLKPSDIKLRINTLLQPFCSYDPELKTNIKEIWNNNVEPDDCKNILDSFGEKLNLTMRLLQGYMRVPARLIRIKRFWQRCWSLYMAIILHT